MSKKAFAIVVATGLVALTLYQRCEFGAEVETGGNNSVKTVQ
jgi:hypothetical protein